LTKIALYASDVTVSRKFYAALGFRVLDRSDDGVVVALGENVLELRADEHAVAGPHYFTPEIERFPRGTGVEITIETDALDEIDELARARDVDVIRPLGRNGLDGAQILLSDPDGYLLRFVSPDPARPRVVATRAAAAR
jgi:catechol 2,3-dioxygenase-like lactoylglutathione lyase family enzyme